MGLGSFTAYAAVGGNAEEMYNKQQMDKQMQQMQLENARLSLLQRRQAMANQRVKGVGGRGGGGGKAPAKEGTGYGEGSSNGTVKLEQYDEEIAKNKADLHEGIARFKSTGDPKYLMDTMSRNPRIAALFHNPQKAEPMSEWDIQGHKDEILKQHPDWKDLNDQELVDATMKNYAKFTYVDQAGKIQESIEDINQVAVATGYINKNTPKSRIQDYINSQLTYNRDGSKKGSVVSHIQAGIVQAYLKNDTKAVEELQSMLNAVKGKKDNTAISGATPKALISSMYAKEFNDAYKRGDEKAMREIEQKIYDAERRFDTIKTETSISTAKAKIKAALTAVGSSNKNVRGAAKNILKATTGMEASKGDTINYGGATMRASSILVNGQDIPIASWSDIHKAIKYAKVNGWDQDKIDALKQVQETYKGVKTGDVLLQGLRTGESKQTLSAVLLEQAQLGKRPPAKMKVLYAGAVNYAIEKAKRSEEVNSITLQKAFDEYITKNGKVSLADTASTGGDTAGSLLLAQYSKGRQFEQSTYTGVADKLGAMSKAQRGHGADYVAYAVKKIDAYKELHGTMPPQDQVDKWLLEAKNLGSTGLRASATETMETEDQKLTRQVMNKAFGVDKLTQVSDMKAINSPTYKNLKAEAWAYEHKLGTAVRSQANKVMEQYKTYPVAVKGFAKALNAIDFMGKLAEDNPALISEIKDSKGFIQFLKKEVFKYVPGGASSMKAFAQQFKSPDEFMQHLANVYDVQSGTALAALIKAMSGLAVTDKEFSRWKDMVLGNGMQTAETLFSKLSSTVNSLSQETLQQADMLWDSGARGSATTLAENMYKSMSLMPKSYHAVQKREAAVRQKVDTQYEAIYTSHRSVIDQVSVDTGVGLNDVSRVYNMLIHKQRPTAPSDVQTARAILERLK